MPVSYDQRGWSSGSTHSGQCLGEKYEVIKEIGDGSFGSVALARVRAGGAHIAKRNTMVAIKTMKKTFDSFKPCLELREIIFLRQLPEHRHLVPALDIFLDPMTKKLHIAMEYMDGNLYQLMKARDHKSFDGSSVKSILFQIMSGLEHIHENDFFHRDIKPENILVTVSSQETGNAFKRYSSMVTPPSTPPSYTVKIADFGLARETRSKLPYTTYVSTRWYRAPEVLLRAGEYSAPVDIWAVGAMAVEIATLKPLFPGSNEVDQVWRVCEIMGSPGTWVTKDGERIGGGKWSEGVKLAQKLGFSFPRMMPHGMDTILPAPQWPPSLRLFVTQCLLWDPKARPTTAECLQHEYFQDAHDPLRPKSSSRLMSRKRSDLGHPRPNQSIDSTQSLTSKGASWIRKSLVARESAPAVPQHFPEPHAISPRMTPTEQVPAPAPVQENVARPVLVKRTTWADGAPMQLLPSIRPVAPLTINVNAQGHAAPQQQSDIANAPSKIGRQLSMASSGNHYAEIHRQEAERALNGQTTPASPPSSHKEGFLSWSHLRKRARRLSGRRPSPGPGNQDDIEASAGCAPWAANRNSGMVDSMFDQDPTQNPDFGELDRALNNVRYSIDATVNAPLPPHPVKQAPRTVSNPNLKRHHSLPPVPKQETASRISHSPSMRRIRRGGQKSGLLSGNFEAPDEQEELLDEALAGAQAAIARMDQQAKREQQMREASAMRLDLGFLNDNRRAKSDAMVNAPVDVPYPTPSPSKNHREFFLDSSRLQTQPIPIQKPQPRYTGGQTFPTPPDDNENDWIKSVLAAGEQWR